MLAPEDSSRTMCCWWSPRRAGRLSLCKCRSRRNRAPTQLPPICCAVKLLGRGQCYYDDFVEMVDLSPGTALPSSGQDELNVGKWRGDGIYSWGAPRKNAALPALSKAYPDFAEPPHRFWCAPRRKPLPSHRGTRRMCARQPLGKKGI